MAGDADRQAGLTIGVDIGGTKIAAGVVDAFGTVLARSTMPTPTTDTDALVRAIVESIGGLANAHPIAGVGIGVAGLVNETGEIVHSASHLPLRQHHLRAVIAAAVGLPIVVHNDANAAGWAEARFGAAADTAEAVFVGVGTGIGGAIISDGRVRQGAHGAGGEIGHMIVERDGRPCPCGSRGCWEQYASGRAFVRAAHRAGFTAEHGSAVTAAAREGDERARSVFDEIGGWLGLGIAGLAAVFDPAVVVVGGGLSAAGDLLMEPARRTFAEYLTARGHRPEPVLVLAALGPDAGMIGAAELAREPL